MTRAELVVKVKTEMVESMLQELEREGAAIRRTLDRGERLWAKIVFDLVDDFIAHCRRWDPK